MKHSINIAILFFLILIPFSVISQEFDFKRKTISLSEIDTTNCIEFITRNARIIVDKSDYLNRLNEDPKFHSSYIDTINSFKRPSICLIHNQTDQSICKESLILQFTNDNAMIISYDLAKILLTGKSRIIINSHNSRIYKIKARKRTYKEAMGSTYLEFIDPKSNKEILSLLIGLGE